MLLSIHLVVPSFISTNVGMVAKKKKRRKPCISFSILLNSCEISQDFFFHCIIGIFSLYFLPYIIPAGWSQLSASVALYTPPFKCLHEDVNCQSSSSVWEWYMEEYQIQICSAILWVKLICMVVLGILHASHSMSGNAYHTPTWWPQCSCLRFHN